MEYFFIFLKILISEKQFYNISIKTNFIDMQYIIKQVDES